MRDYLELPVDADTDNYRLELHVIRKDTAGIYLVVWNFTSAIRLDGFWHISVIPNDDRGVRTETEYLIPAEDVGYFKVITHFLDQDQEDVHTVKATPE